MGKGSFLGSRRKQLQVKVILRDFFPIASNFRGVGGPGKGCPSPIETFAQVFDCADAESEFPGEGLGPGDACGKEIEEGFEAALFAERLAELAGLGGAFLANEGFGRAGFGCGEGLEQVNKFAVIGEDQSQVGLVAEEGVFFAVAEAVHMFGDQASEFVRGGVEFHRCFSGPLPDFGDGFGGDTVGVEAVGQDPAESAAPPAPTQLPGRKVQALGAHLSLQVVIPEPSYIANAPGALKRFDSDLRLQS